MTRILKRLLFSVLLLNFFISLAVFIALFALKHSSSHFDINNPTANNYPLRGPRFDLETWCCELQRFYPAFKFADSNLLGQQCAEEAGARWLSLVLVLLFIPLGSLIVFDLKSTWPVLFFEKRVRRGSVDSVDSDWI
jgi:hypothetical protein